MRTVQARFLRGFAFSYTAAMLRTLAAVLVLAACTGATDKSAPHTLQWAEGLPNCTLRSGDDGHTYYRLSSGDFEITLAVDRQELAMVPHRALPMIGVFVSFQYKGSGELQVRQDKFALEFLRHHRVVQNALAKSGMLGTLQRDADEVRHQTEKHVRKHLEDKQKEEAELHARLKDLGELAEFIKTRALQPGTLDATHPSTSGWVFFSTEDRWIGTLHSPEQFVLRLPVEKLMVEFPFQLPPKVGKMELRRRPGN
jgi:hypothetical protein